MTESIVINATVSVANGPKLTINRTLAVDAYDKIDVKILKDETGKDVNLLPAASTSLTFLLIVSDHYHSGLSYRVNTGTTDYTLDQPQMFIGKGAIEYLDVTPQKLVIKNTGANAKDLNVQILLGRGTS